jgi:hypothetical protein
MGININLYFLGFSLPFSHFLDQFYYLFMIHYLSPIFISNFTNFCALWVSFLFYFFDSFLSFLEEKNPPVGHIIVLKYNQCSHTVLYRALQHSVPLRQGALVSFLEDFFLLLLKFFQPVLWKYLPRLCMLVFEVI